MPPEELVVEEVEETFPFPSYRPGQGEALKEAAKAIADSEDVLLEGPVGCHEKGQKVLMYRGLNATNTHHIDGAYSPMKRVEDVEVGDVLLGPDGNPRHAICIHRGTEDMYKIKPNRGQDFIVNGGHLLTLIRTNDGTNLSGEMIDVKVRDYLDFSNNQKRHHKLIRSDRQEFSSKKLPIPPRILGIFLGDGGLTEGARVTTQSEEIKEEIEDYAQKFNYSVTEGFEGGCYSLRISCKMYGEGEHPNKEKRAKARLMRYEGIENDFTDRYNGSKNKVYEKIKEMNLDVKSKDKFIPFAYKTSSVEDRLSLLSGLIDTDGHVGENSTIDITLSSEDLVKDIAFISHSLGFRAVTSKKGVEYNGETREYYRVHISGDTEEIPVKLEQKQIQDRKSKKDVLRDGFDIEYVGEGEYYGFTLTGDGRYLLDDFTITHNSGKSPIAIALARWVDSCVITTPLNSLVDQYYEDFGDMQGVEVVKGRRNYRCYHEDDDGGDWDGNRTCDHCPCQWDPELITMVTDNPETQACRCDYAKAKRRAMRTPVVMTNLHMAMLAPFVSGDHDLLIIDEGHNLESVIANHVTSNIDPFEFETHPPDTDNWLDHYDWVRKKGLPEARENFENFKNLVENRNQTDEDTVDKLNKWERIKRRLKWLQSDYKKNNEDWIVLRDDYNDKVTYKPVTGTRFIENRLYDIADNVLLMSATPPTRDEVALSGARKVTAPMHFPKENRPIKFDYRGSMTYEERDDSYLDIAQGIKDVQEGKTLVHSHAYSIANELYDELTKIGADVAMQDRYNREESLQNWIESDNDIFLSVNMTEGIDLKGDKCRTQVLVKTPWPNFGDDWVQARKEKLGWGKISHRVTRDIVQAYGRAIRSADDEATFYIMDSNFEKFWKRNQKRFPDWFVEAIDYDEVKIA